MSTKKEFVLKICKGNRGRAANNYVLAKRQAVHSMVYQKNSRKLLKRDVRAQWIQQINAATRQFGLSYGQFIHGLDRAEIRLDRKMLAELAVTEPFTFQALTEYSKKHIPWRNTNARRMTADDFSSIKKGEIPPEWDPKLFPPPIQALKQRIDEQMKNADKKADEINKKLVATGKVVLSKKKKKAADYNEKKKASNKE